VLRRLGFGDGLWVWPWVCGLWPWVMGGLGRLGLIFCICGVRVASMGCGSPAWVWPCGLPAWVFLGLYFNGFCDAGVGVVEIVGKKKKK
jgi:hypothetical protein